MSELRKAAENSKPCPFCGGTDIRYTKHAKEGMGIHRLEDVYSMCCYMCGAHFPNMYSPMALMEKWNRRKSITTEQEQEPVAWIPAFRSPEKDGWYWGISSTGAEGKCCYEGGEWHHMADRNYCQFYKSLTTGER